MALVDELFISLGFKVNDKEVKRAENSLKSIIGTATKVATAVVGATIALDRMANSLARNNQEFINFNRQTGLTLDKMQSIATAGMLVDYNFDTSTAMSSLQALESNLAQIRMGEGNIAPFQILGISPVGKNAYQIIEDLREAIKGIDDMTAVNLIQQMGLSPQFISVLRLSKAEMQSLNQELMLSSEERQSLQQYSMELRKITMQFGLLKDRALIAIMPALNDFLGGVHALVVMFGNLIKGLMTAWNWLGKLKISIIALGLGLLTYLNPVIGALTMLYFLLEDIAVWTMGGKSFLGTTFDIGTEKFQEMLDGLKAFFEKLGDIIKGFWSKVGGFWDKFLDGFKTISAMSMRTFNPQLAFNMSANTPNMANMNTSNVVNQTNYFNSTGAMPERLATQTTDLAFAYMQIDRAV